MGNIRSLKRSISPKFAYIAKDVEQKRIDIVKKIVEERINKDAEFAAECIKQVGALLPEELRVLAEQSIANHTINEEATECCSHGKCGCSVADVEPKVLQDVSDTLNEKQQQQLKDDNIAMLAS